jgi:hypothetical protein
MGYQSVAALESDHDFRHRVRACVLEQSLTFKDAGAADQSTTAKQCLKDNPEILSTFLRVAICAPGLADKAQGTNPDGSVDSTQITDGDILAVIQGQFLVVASMFFDSTGAPVA